MDTPAPLRQLPTAARTRWRVQGGALGVLVGTVTGLPPAIVGGVLLVSLLPVLVPVVLAAVGAALGLVWADRRYARFRYALDHERLAVRDGVVVHHDAIAPLYRVQHVDLTRGPLQLSFGLATLRVHTAAPAADIRLPDLRVEDAERVRDEILASSERAAQALGVADVDAV